MTVTIDSFALTGKNLYEGIASSDLGGTPDLYIYIDGILWKITSLGIFQVSVAESEQIKIEILDDVNDTPEAAYPGRATLIWYAPDKATKYYRVEEYIASSWTTPASGTPPIVWPTPGQTYFTLKTRVLEDDTTHQFRIVPVGENDEDGSPRTFTIPMRRLPDPPTATYSWDSGTGEVTATIS